MLADTTRYEYFKNRRQSKKQMVFLVDKELGAALDAKLKEKGIARIEWFRQKIQEELEKEE